VFILVDGARADVFYEMLSQGLLPNIEKHVAKRGVIVENAVTVFPSTTGPAHAPFLTGAFPGPLNMPGIRWFDRRKNSYQNYGPLAWLQFERDYVGPEAFAMNKDMSGKIKTIFERLKGRTTAAIFEPITRGAKFVYPPLANVMAKILDPLRLFTWEHVDVLAARTFEMVYRCSALIKWIKLPSEPPVFSAVYMPGVDEVSHEHGPLSKKVRHAMQNVDKQIGHIAKTLIDLKLYDETSIVIGADHGLRPTNLHFNLGKFLSTVGLDVRSFPVTFLQGLGEFDATVAVSGNGMAHVYLAAEGAEEKAFPLQYIKHDWQRKPTLEDLENYKIRKGRVNIIDLMSHLLPVQHVFVAENKNTFHVHSCDGHGVIRKRYRNEYSYDVIEGKDPLGYASIVEDGKIAYGEWLDDREWLAATCEAEFPDAPVQVSQIFESPRSGDLIINSRMGWDLMPESPPHRGSHGGLHAAEMKVPLLVANSSYEVKPDQPLRTLDVLDILLA
jgi:predicted AlkP superfamily pyrophosphatase or phosphodiesterase